MTFYNQMVPGTPDDHNDIQNVAVPPHSDVEIEWHGGSREQGGYAVARPAGGSMDAMQDALGRYEQACGADDISVSAPVQQEQPKAPSGTVAAAPQGLRMIEVRGVPVKVDPTIFDDFELLESLAEVQRGDVLALPSVFRAVAGEQASALLNAVRGGNGKVTATAATEVLVQIMRALAPKA